MDEPKGRIGGSNKVVSMHYAASYLQVSYKYFASMYKMPSAAYPDRWGIPHHRIGGRVKFRVRDLENYLDSTREAA